MTTDEQIADVREYFSKTFDGNKVVPILDEFLEMRNTVITFLQYSPYRLTQSKGLETCAYCDRVEGHEDSCVWVHLKASLE
jgi:hypothetical protein